MKIAVYGVARDEENNVKEWFESSKDADFHLILDTGSKDNTVSIAKDLGISVHEAFFSPWDESMAKNVAMSLIPKDIDLCILLDLDQRIYTKDWKSILIKTLSEKKYNIVEHDLIDNLDFINTDVNKIKIKNIHSRDNCFWHKYRPRLDTVIKSSYDPVVYAPVTIRHVLGNEKRYVDRESVYLDSWEIEYQKTNNFIKFDSVFSSNRYLLEIVAHQAFNFFETKNAISEDLSVIADYDARFIFMSSLLYPENAEKYLKYVSKQSLYYVNAIVKLDIIDFWKNGIISDSIKSLNSFEKIVAYADSKTGRHKVELAKQAYKYFTGKEYINEEN